MLTTKISWRALAGSVLALLIIGTTLVGFAPSAQAQDCPYKDPDTGDMVYCEDDEDEGGDETGGDEGGGGGNEEPTCDLSVNEYADYCVGEYACWANVPAALEPDDDLDPWDHPGPPPSEDAVFSHQRCYNPDGSENPGMSGYYWEEDPPEPPLPDQAEIAWGRLGTPDFSVEFRPADMTYVGTDTYFWVEGPGSGRIVGDPAFTLYAVGTPSHIEIDLGNGNGSIECPWALAKTDDCTWTYQNSSAGSSVVDQAGVPSFNVGAVLVYDVHFERLGNPGVPVEMPNLPPEFTTLSSNPQTVPVPVGEIQALVR